MIGILSYILGIRITARVIFRNISKFQNPSERSDLPFLGFRGNSGVKFKCNYGTQRRKSCLGVIYRTCPVMSEDMSIQNWYYIIRSDLDDVKVIQINIISLNIIVIQSVTNPKSTSHLKYLCIKYSIQVLQGG